MEENNTKENRSLQGVLYFFILLLLFVLLAISAYAGFILYEKLYGEPENLSVVIPPNLNNSYQYSGEVRQFNKNMKFNHNTITVRFFDCSYEEESRMEKAFEIIKNETKVIDFQKTKEIPDIEILCSEASKQTDVQDSDYFIAGEGGAKEIIQTEKYNVILSGSVLLYNSPQGGLKCANPNIELHELIHVFGFDHSSNEKSLMYPYLTSCNQGLDLSIIDELKRLYSQENLPDLYFEEFSQPMKKSRYLNLNFTIKNSGTIDAKNATFSIIENNQLLETHTLGDIKFGAGILMKMENIRLKSSDPKTISIVIDYNNKIKELDKSNNIAEISI